jgi:hypothetical protein
MSNPDVYVVVRQPDGGRRTMAYHGAVYNTHAAAVAAMHKHKSALKKYNPRDAQEVRVIRSSNPRRIR